MILGLLDPIVLVPGPVQNQSFCIVSLQGFKGYVDDSNIDT
jgi:hypothetical protein